jgi:hypothetical protein
MLSMYRFDMFQIDENKGKYIENLRKGSTSSSVEIVLF